LSEGPVSKLDQSKKMLEVTGLKQQPNN
jgi:hypothetical protein